MPAAVPAIATRAFDSANSTGVGSIVQTTINGITVPAKIVAVANAFPTITGSGLVMDLPTLEAFLVSHGTAPVDVTQWWLATADGQVPASLTRALPPGATITSSAALAAATVADPLSAAPQQALLAVAAAAALLAISGFWVSIAANVRQRRAENALLAALGVGQRVRRRPAVPRKTAAIGPRRRARPAPRHHRRPPAGTRRHPQPHRAGPRPAAAHPVRPTADDPARRRRRRPPRTGRRPRRLPPPRPRRRTPRSGGSVSPRRYRPRGLYLWLALLTFIAVFAATAGAREALASRTQAVRQTLAATTPSTRTITVSAAWNDVQGALSYVNSGNALTSIIPSATIDGITDQLHDDFNHAPVTLDPTGTDWSSITTPLNLVNGELPGTGGTPVKIEVTERQPFGPQMRLVSGRFPVATPVPSTVTGTGTSTGTGTGTGKPRGKPPAATLQVVMTKQTAATFGLHAGSKFMITGPELASTGVATPITVLVTGIVTPVDPTSSFWNIDAAIVAADLQGPVNGPYWAGGVIVGPSEADELQSYFSSGNLQMEWVFPLDVSSLDGQQVQPLSDALDKIGTQVPALSGLAPVSATLTTSSGLLFSLNTFIATAQSVDALLWLLYVSLTVAGLTVLLLAGRMVAMRRSAEITVVRARGASLRQIALSTGRDAALVCVPAAVIAAAAAILAVPGAGSAQGAGSAGGWWPPIAVLAVAVCGPALIAAWQHRLPRRRAAARRRQRAGTRLVIEAALVAASVAGIVAFRDQGAQAGSGVNLFTSSAPVLVAIPAVIVVLRLYPLVLRGLVRASARTSRAPAFLGLARASRTALTPALPAFALVLALTVAAFAGMVRDAVTNGEVAASWQTAGADATVTPSSAAVSFTIAPTAARAIAAVPGVTHAAEVWNEIWSTPAGSQVNVLAVDPASYAELVAHTQGFPQVPPQLLATPSQAGAPQPVLVSPQAAADLGQRRGLAQHRPGRRPGGSGPRGRRGLEHARAARRRRVRDHAAGRDHVHGHAAAADPHRRDAADRRVHRPGAAHGGGAANAAGRGHDLPFGRALRPDRRATAARGVHAVLARGRGRRDPRPRRHAPRARARLLGTGGDARSSCNYGPWRRTAGVGGRARGAARGHRRRGGRLGLRPGAAAGARPGHRPVGVHRVVRHGAAGGRRGLLRGAACRPGRARGRVAWHRDQVGAPARPRVPSGRRMNGVNG